VKISIFGLGYVGAVTGACLARLGHHVVGCDPDAYKVDCIAAGRSPILEPGLDEFVADAVAAGRLTANRACEAACDRAVAETDLSLICVGTPSAANGALDLQFVERVAVQIGRAIRRKRAYHSVVVRSTVLPGTTQGLVVPTLERESHGRAGEAFGISMHPEFLREGASIEDFYEPPMLVVGTDSAKEFRRVSALYRDAGDGNGDGRPVNAEPVRCGIPTAEMIKYACNLFHAVKITFANEVGQFCRGAGVDAREVMGLFCRDHKLNLSPRYLKPGFAFGGSCLPKDLRACLDRARKSDVPLPMLDAVLLSNRVQIERVAERATVRMNGSRKLSLMGISFKESTDDLRESPLVRLAETLIGRGYDLRIYDPNVRYASVFGSNKTFIDAQLPHLKSLLVDADAALAHAKYLVFGHNDEIYRELLPKLRPEHRVLDLADVASGAGLNGQYEGLYW
jgi:GDP-mannose 6-dehydrogenase